MPFYVEILIYVYVGYIFAISHAIAYMHGMNGP